MKCKYETTRRVDMRRCLGTKEVDPCPGYDKCKHYKPVEELKPCPFCGNKVKRVIGFGGLNFSKCSYAKCGAVVSFDNDYYNTHTGEAVEAWNRRHHHE